MVDNPYKVLGLSEGATADEIKKAYRKKAKECHPDLHPNDPHAQEKMNEVNEAYDMLTNPEKYAARRPSGSSSYGQSSQSSGYSSGYSGSYGNSGSYDARSSQGYNQYSSYGGSGGWSTNNFSADDFFSFFFGGMGGMGSNVNTAPKREAGDSADIAYAVDCINAGRYQDALAKLVRIPSTGRNARWYYLSALANNGIGNGIRAKEHIQRAVELDPNNQVYKAVYRKVSNTAGAGYSYNAGNSGSYGSSSYSNGSSDQSDSGNGGYTYRRRSRSLLGMVGRVIVFLLVLRFIRMIFALMMSGGMYQMMR